MKVAQRQKDHQRNPELEKLLEELNSLLEPVETKSIEAIKSNKYPLVLIMGNPRSGTTLFMQWLANLGCFAYPTNLLSRFYGAPSIGAKIQLMLTKHDFNNEICEFKPSVSFSSRLGKTKGALAPNEFWYFWRRFFPYGEIQSLNEDELKMVDVKGFIREIAAMESVFEMPVAMKGTITNWNIPFMAQNIDRVLFVYIKRNPYFVMQSLLQARLDYYGVIDVWHSYKPPEYSFLKDLSPYEQIAGQVYYTKLAVEAGLAQVEDSRKLIIDYEDLCSDPCAIFRQISNRFKQQGMALKWDYDGPKSFSSSRKITLLSEEVDKLKSFYQAFSGEVLSL